jgi:hypothetical protein
MMSVIINDFEVVVESGPGTGAAKEMISTETAKPTLTPQDIRDIIRRQNERTLRIYAD